MAERAGDYEWRGEGEHAEVVLYAPGDAALERVLPAARLPGVESPVFAAASDRDFGWVAVSVSHAAPALVSAPARGMLLVADAEVEELGIPAGDLASLIYRRLQETRRPGLGGPGMRRVCEEGAPAMAERGLIEEDDLAYLVPRPGDVDALDRRTLAAGDRDWERPGEWEAKAVGEALDAEGAEALGIRPGTLVVVARAGAGDPGRLVLASHGERILVRGGDFGSGAGLPAAPTGSGEASDFLAAVGAVANFADGRAALLVYALRRALEDVVGTMSIRASWTEGGLEAGEGRLVHRRGLAALGSGGVLVPGGAVASGTGKMWGSAPPFGVSEDVDGRWPWEEAGLLERLAKLEPLGD